MPKSLQERFAGLDRAYGLYEIEAGEGKAGVKRKGRAETLQRPVTAELWAAHLAGTVQLGIVPIRDDASCVFGAIDVDDYRLDHLALERKIKKLKLPLLMVRSKSGGAHLYAFVSKPIEAQKMREALADWAAALGYANVEIFPKQSRLHSSSDTGNWINMPYCGGDASDRHCILDGQQQTLEQFLALAEAREISPRKLGAILETDEAPEMLVEGPPCLVTLATQGIPEGTRNTTLFNLGVYAKRRWADDWEPRLREMNNQFINPPVDDNELKGVIMHLQRKDYAYTCKDKPLCNVCAKHACMKREFGIGPVDAQSYFGIGLENVIRLETSTPIYFADMNEKRVTFTPKDINSQSRFRELMISQVNEPFQLMSQVKWTQFIIALCNKADIVEAPPETREHAEMSALLEEFCTEQIPARDWSDIVDGSVLEDGGRMHFRPHKFTGYVTREKRQKLSVEEAYKALIGANVSSEDREIDGKVYKIWSVPSFSKPKKRAARPKAEEM